MRTLYITPNENVLRIAAEHPKIPPKKNETLYKIRLMQRVENWCRKSELTKPLKETTNKSFNEIVFLPYKAISQDYIFPSNRYSEKRTEQSEVLQAPKSYQTNLLSEVGFLSLFKFLYTG